MKKLLMLLTICASVTSGYVGAVEINVCLAETGKNNKLFHNLATTRTRLVCEQGDKNKRYTLPELYSLNWELIKVIDGTMVNNQYRAPVYYFERLKAPKKKR